jgi:beta-glucosidase
MRCFLSWRSLCVGLTLLAAILPLLLDESHTSAQSNVQYLFQNPDLPTEQRIDNLPLVNDSRREDRMSGTNPSVPRLGIKASGHVEGFTV